MLVEYCRTEAMSDEQASYDCTSKGDDVKAM